MDKTDALHELIHTLKKSEKRHFKLYASAYSSGRNYLRLFDALEQQETYNEQLICEQFKGEKFITQLYATKSYLYKLILKSLCDCYSEQSYSMQLFDMLKQIFILYYKGLFDQANRILSKACKHVLAHEMHFMMPYVAFWQKKIWLRTFDKEALKNDSEELDKLTEESLQGIRNTLDYYKLAEKQLLIQRTTGDRKSPRENDEWINLSSDPLLKDERHALTYESQFLYYNIQYIFSAYLQKDNVELKRQYAQKAYELAKVNYGQKDEDSLRYIGSMKNLAGSIIPESPFEKHTLSEEVGTVLTELEKLEDKLKTYSTSRYTTYRILSTLLIYQLNHYLTYGEYVMLLDILKKNDSILKDTYTRSNRLDVYYSLYTLGYFGCGEYRKALHYLTDLQGLPNLPENSGFAWKIVNLVIHYELKDFDLIEHRIKSFYRQLLRMKKTFRFEFVVLDFLRKKMLKARNEQELIGAFSALYKELILLYEDPLEKPAFKYFDLLSWLESKILQKPFQVIVKEKTGSGNFRYLT